MVNVGALSYSAAVSLLKVGPAECVSQIIITTQKAAIALTTHPDEWGEPSYK